MRLEVNVAIFIMDTLNTQSGRLLVMRLTFNLGGGEWIGMFFLVLLARRQVQLSEYFQHF